MEPCIGTEADSVLSPHGPGWHVPPPAGSLGWAGLGARSSADRLRRLVLPAVRPPRGLRLPITVRE